MFLTDGCGSSHTKEALKQALAAAKKARDIESRVYCLGLSSCHDANLLNYMAQMGSSVGNFIYIEDTRNTASISDALNRCLELAVAETSYSE
jgi:hypothetical protein